MQLFALNGEQRLFAGQAIKGQRYRCPECLSTVRVRSGPHRKPHFFHAQHSHCRQSGKTIFHLNAQLYIQTALPQDKAHLEVAFPSINRIADVVWEEKKIIFEVQCSPISHQEAKQRTLDYESLGYQVIWILHERRFNKRNISMAEDYLLGKICYFTSINELGKGSIYDQFHVMRNYRRLFKGPPLPVKIDQPVLLRKYPFKATLPQQLLQRKHLEWGFKGDLLARCQTALEKDFLPMCYLENRYSKKTPFWHQLHKTILWFQNVYLSFLDALLEKHSS